MIVSSVPGSDSVKAKDKWHKSECLSGINWYENRIRTRYFMYWIKVWFEILRSLTSPKADTWRRLEGAKPKMWVLTKVSMLVQIVKHKDVNTVK